MALIATVMLCGCAGSMQSVSDFLLAGPWWSSAQTGEIRSRALDLEAQGEFARALDHWRLVQRMSVDQAESGQQIARLEKVIADAVQSHYQKGLATLEGKKPAVARNHFLAALRLDPGFQPALRQIKAHYSPFPLAVYLSAAGDRPATVARKVFNDEKKAFLVAWFNDLPEDGTMPPGTLLILPKLEKMPSKKVRKKKPPDRLAAARKRLAKKDFEGALTLAGQANPDDPGTRALVHSIHLEMAAARIQSSRFEDARQSLDRVPDGFPGKEATLEKLATARQHQQAAIDLAGAREHFDGGRYQQSLDLAQAVIENAPDSEDARNLAAEARYRVALDHFDHRRFLKAREVLSGADDDHEASSALQEAVRARLSEMAQIYYRNGVKDFINEDLESAIAEWEKALVCNPDHEKASENIDNARRLLEKIETLP
jgi:tetratricopeptide (TPR) repeat protein